MQQKHALQNIAVAIAIQFVAMETYTVSLVLIMLYMTLLQHIVRLFNLKIKIMRLILKTHLFIIFLVILCSNFMTDNTHEKSINLNLQQLSYVAQAQGESGGNDPCDTEVGQCSATSHCTGSPCKTSVCCTGWSNCYANSGYAQCDGVATYCPGYYGIPC